MKVCLPSYTLTKFARRTALQPALIGLTTLALITPLTSSCFGQFTAVESATSDDGHSILIREGEQLDAVEPHQSGSTPKPYSHQFADTSEDKATDTHVVASESLGGGFVSSSSKPERVDRDDFLAKRLPPKRLSSNGLRSNSTGNLRPAKFMDSQSPAFSERTASAFEEPKTSALTEQKLPAVTKQKTLAFTPRQVPDPRSNEDIAPLPRQRRISSPQRASFDNDVIVDRSVTPTSYAAPVQSSQKQSFQNQSSQNQSFPNQSFENQNQSRRSFQSLQPRQNAGQANGFGGRQANGFSGGQANGFSGGQTNRHDNRGNQGAQSAHHRQENRSSSKSSSSAKVLISKFGLNSSQNASQDNSENLIPLRLADVLNQGQGRASRGQLIDQYWETFDGWAQSVSAKQHRDWVNGLRVSKSTDQSTVGVAKSNAENDVTSNRIQLGKSQAKLKSILGTRASIVPADLPTVTMVKTNFQAFKERGLIPARLEGIDQTLNDLHDLVLSRADTVLMAERAAEQVKGYYQSNQATIEQVLGAGRAWRSAEVDFVSSAIEYNKAYADYALALPYGQAPVEQVVAMLVVPNNVAPSSAAPYAGGNSQQAQFSRPQQVPSQQAQFSRSQQAPSQQAQFSRSRQAQSQPAQFSQTPSQPSFSSRSESQRRGNSPQTGLDPRVRSASNGFGRSSASQSVTTRPMPDFTDSHNAAEAAASFDVPKAPVFRPNSVASQQPTTVAPQRGSFAAPQRPNTAFSQRSSTPPRQEQRSPSTSFGGGSAAASIAAGARENLNAAAKGLGFSDRTASQTIARPTAPVSRPAVQPISRPSVEPVSQPVARSPVTPSASSFGGGKPAVGGSSGFSSRAINGLKETVTDPFSSRPAATQPVSQPAAQPPTKPTTSFEPGGSGNRNNPPGSGARDGFSSGFGR